METTYIFLLVVLALLAITDLIVGVSNDAVNFLNSAIGSKAISFRTIMIIVSVGIFLGAVFSSGMMEVARKGIFVPSQFYFDEIMIIFLAVMITDILLLDFFNTLGMPTSTTVSIVFELLGAAVIISALKILVEQNGSITEITQYINTTKATEIIVGILLSVFIAFIVGAIVQWISRLIFTFQYNNKMKALGSIFGGLALASIFYFILYKGLKGTPYYDSYKNTLDEQLWVILFAITLSCTLFSFVFTNVFKKNILVVVVGAGTFGLALAFAGNDLVNFIGVPMAAYHSFEAWSSSGVIPSEFSMVVLEQKVPAESLILLFSGGIMVLTLWFSKKAKTVTETTINLSRQGDGYEKFKPNLVARYLVRSGVWLGDLTYKGLPNQTIAKINRRFANDFEDATVINKDDAPAFDLIRASVNLVVAGILISVATSMKLPLSTTYVTFMVAMGTSLADRAWGRESAIYRVAGVINVIGGWFLTALVAFLVAGILAWIFYYGGIVSIVVVLMLTIGVLFRNYILHNTNSIISFKTLRISSENKSIDQIIEESSTSISQILNNTLSVYSNNFTGLAKRDEKALKKNKKDADKLINDIEELRGDLFYFIKGLEENSLDGSKFYIDMLVHLTDLGQSLELITRKSYKHVINNHKSLRFSQIKEFQEVNKSLTSIFIQLESIYKNMQFDTLEPQVSEMKSLSNSISNKINNQVAQTRAEESSPKNTALYFSLMLETKDLIDSSTKLIELYRTATN